jgi:hypothetical protein
LTPRAQQATMTPVECRVGQGLEQTREKEPVFG